jgi:hypothetical protein
MSTGMPHWQSSNADGEKHVTFLAHQAYSVQNLILRQTMKTICDCHDVSTLKFDDGSHGRFFCIFGLSNLISLISLLFCWNNVSIF